MTAALPDDELLDGYEALVVWCVRLGVISEADGEMLLRTARADEKGARRALTRAKELRELVYAIFRPIADGAEPPEDLLDELRDAGRNALASAHLAPWPHSAPRCDALDMAPAPRARRPASPDHTGGRRVAHERPARPRESLRQLSLALPRPEPQPQPALVLDGRVRDADEAAALRGAPPPQP